MQFFSNSQKAPVNTQQLTYLRRGLLIRSVDIAMKAGINFKRIENLPTNFDSTMLLGRYLALKELYDNFDSLFQTFGQISDKNIESFQNGVFVICEKLIKKHGFNLLLDKSQVDGQPPATILDYGRVLELLHITEDAVTTMAIGKNESAFKDQLEKILRAA